MPILSKTSSGGSRGCGSRVQGGIYLCTGFSEQGSPLEAFLIDPVVLFDSAPGESYRTPILRENPYMAGVMDAYVWVGESFYPSLVDFVEEARCKGASRRVSPLLDLSQLTPGKSRMIFIHPKAYTETLKVPTQGCPKAIENHGQDTPCIGAHWHYAESLGSVTDHSGNAVIGDVRYTLPEQVPAPDDCRPGLFMALPITHIEFENDGNPLPKTVRKASDAGFDVFVMDQEVTHAL